MRQCPIQECGPRRRVARGIAKHAGIARRHAHCTDSAQKGCGAFGIMTGAHNVADKIEKKKPGASDNLGWQAIEPNSRGKF